MTRSNGKNLETFKDLAQTISSGNKDINDVQFFPLQLQKSHQEQTSVQGSIVDEIKTEKISKSITLESSSTIEQGSRQNSNDGFVSEYSTYLWWAAAGLGIIVTITIKCFIEPFIDEYANNAQENPPARLKLIDHIRLLLTDQDHVPHNPSLPHDPHFGLFGGGSFIIPTITEGSFASSNADILSTVQASLVEPGTEMLQPDNLLMNLLTSASTSTSVVTSHLSVEAPTISHALTPESGALISLHEQHTDSYCFVIQHTDINEVSSIQSITTQGQLVPFHEQAEQESTSNSQSHQLTEYFLDVITATIYGGPDHEPQTFTATPSQLINFLHSSQGLQLWDSLMDSGSAVALIYRDTICLYLFPCNETPVPQALMISTTAEEQYL